MNTESKEVETIKSLHYYIIPSYCVAIPKEQNAYSTLQNYLTKQANFTLPSIIADYPCVTRKQLQTFFSNYTILPITVAVTFTPKQVKSLPTLTPLEVASRNIAKRLEQLSPTIHHFQPDREERIQKFKMGVTG